MLLCDRYRRIVCAARVVRYTEHVEFAYLFGLKRIAVEDLAVAVAENIGGDQPRTPSIRA